MNIKRVIILAVSVPFLLLIGAGLATLVLVMDWSALLDWIGTVTFQDLIGNAGWISAVLTLATYIVLRPKKPMDKTEVPAVFAERAATRTPGTRRS